MVLEGGFSRLIFLQKWITCYFSTQGTGLLGSFNLVEGIALLCAVAAAALRAATSKKELMGAGVVEKSYGSRRV